jgi:hypothetical protein
MIDTILFDRLAFIDRLKRAGIEDNQARAHAEVVEEALREGVATKADIARLENMIHSEITRLENTMRGFETTTHSDILRLENMIHSESTRLENMIHSDITRLENLIHSECTRLETKIDLAVRDLTIRMGAIAMALFAALASIKFVG